MFKYPRPRVDVPRHESVFPHPLGQAALSICKRESRTAADASENDAELLRGATCMAPSLHGLKPADGQSIVPMAAAVMGTLFALSRIVVVALDVAPLPIPVGGHY
jgi:hypothetical protein